MNTTHENKNNLKFHLHRRAFHHMNKIKPGMTIVCEQGMVWLTKSRDINDYMLRQGASMVIGGKSDVLLEALSEADVGILYPN